MSAGVAVVGAPGVAAPRSADAWRRDRRFFTGMAVAATAWLAFATWITR